VLRVGRRRGEFCDELFPSEEGTTQHGCIYFSFYLKAKARIWPSQGQNLALTVLYVPYSLESGSAWRSFASSNDTNKGIIEILKSQPT